MPILHIFRGLPGSGKSTAARKLAAETGAILIEPDALLVHDGKYDYTPIRYEYAKHAALSLLCYATSRGCDAIYADVLPRIEDYHEVIDSLFPGEGAIYATIVHDLKITPEESKLRNCHSVRPEDIDRMAKEWEDWE